MTDSAPYLLIATASDALGQRLSSALRELGLSSLVLTQVEQLLLQTRDTTPAAIILEDALTQTVAQLDLVALLRRRKSLAEVPLICLGADLPERHMASLTSGADLYLPISTPPALLSVYLKHALERRAADAGLRDTLARLREFEGAFLQSERVKDDLTHMLVHDLKSPIASVMGLLDHCIDILGAEGTQNGVQDGMQDIVELLSLARAESQHLLNLAANILDVRRMKEGHMPYQPETISGLTTLAEAALHDVSGAPRERHFSFLVRPEAERLEADPALLRRILANLLSNAVKHTRRGGHIDFRAWKENGTFVLSVRDDGEGIPLEDQKRIFNAFEQSRHTIHDRYDTGMGLTFCKLAVEKHGGKIWVDSKVGRGSTFLFTLPEQVRTTAFSDGIAVIEG